MTLDEFERGYAERSGLTVDDLHTMGLYGIPCNCGDETCDGWQMDWEHRSERETWRPPRWLDWLNAAGEEKLEPLLSKATSARVREIDTDRSFERVSKSGRRSH